MESFCDSAIATLEKAFGKASDEGFGSAVFHEKSVANTDAGEIALKHYKSFLGKKWTKESEQQWKSKWKNVYTRAQGAKPDIMVELASIKDADALVSIPLLTELSENAEACREALVIAFNDSKISALVVYNLGDGESMSGIMITARYTDGCICSVIALMD